MINLGNKYKDVVSGFIGIAVSRHSYINGCERITLQPEIDKDGKLPQTETFDSPQLKEIEITTIKQNNLTGGPEKYSDIREY